MRINDLLMVTMNDIASRAGVSQTTVSFVLNERSNGAKITGETRQRVLDAARDLGYRRNELARAMVTGKSRSLGLLTKKPDSDFEFKSRVLDGVLEGAGELGYSVKIIYLPSEESIDEVIHSCIEWRMAGLVTVSLKPSLMERMRAALRHHQIYLAVVEGSLPTEWGIHIISDDRQGVRLALEHFCSLGHKRIAFLAGRADDTMSNWREDIFRSVMQEMGLILPDEYIVHGDWWEREPNEIAAHQLLQLPTPPTAILCAGDPVAVVVIGVANRLGIQIPEQLSLIGFGNYAFSTLTDPQITTLAQPFQESGKLAVQKIIEQIQLHQSGAEWTDQYYGESLPLHLLKRGSTAPYP